MIPIEHIQFAAITLTGFLTLMLVFILPLRGEAGQVYNRSRWFMVAGTALLPVLKSTRQGLFNPWLTHLRIEEAKRQLALHPEWNNDTIAEHCGFTSRTYFQTTFKRITGVTPQEFQTHQ